MIKKINHIAIVVPELDESMGFWGDALGLTESHSHREEEHGVDVLFLPVGNNAVELVSPFDPESGIGRFMHKRGPGIHHICFEVEDIEHALTCLKSKNVPLIDEVPRQNSTGAKLAFIHPKGTGGVLIELYELPEERS